MNDPIVAARPSKSASVDYVIWSVQTAADEQELRNAKSMLADAIESYADEVTSRTCASTSKGRSQHPRCRGAMPPLGDV
jgi:hypothetical protein